LDLLKTCGNYLIKKIALYCVFLIIIYYFLAVGKSLVLLTLLLYPKKKIFNKNSCICFCYEIQQHEIVA
jgi:hypothetical protein